MMDMQIDPEETWIDLWMNAREFHLEEWDPEIDGPIPLMVNLPEDQSDEEDCVDVKQQDVSIRMPSWHEVEEAPPRTCV